MTSTTYFGRPERNGRHLGDDLDLIGKWSRTFGQGLPLHSSLLSQLSIHDRETLFSAPAQEFQLQEGPNKTVKLTQLQVGEDGGLIGKPDIQSMDPDVFDMMRSKNYIRTESRLYDLACKVDDASEDTEAASALAFAEALRAGVDRPTAEKMAEKAAERHMISIARQVRAGWRAERLQKLIAEASIPSQSASMPSGGMPSNVNIFKEDAPEALEFDSSTADEQATPQPKPVFKVPSPHDCTPGYGSETTTESVHWSSPRYSTDESSSSPELGSTSGFFHDLEGGVALLPSSLADDLGLNTGAAVSESPTTTVSRPNRSHGHGTGCHLGAGLNLPFSVVPTGTNGIFAINDTASAYTASQASCRQTNTAARAKDEPSSTQTKPVSAASQPFSPNSKSCRYPLAKEQPWTGFTCYEVPPQAGNNYLVPKYWTSKRGKERYLRHKLSDLKVDDTKLRADRVWGPVARNPIHIFIDLSNIIIGFYDSMKEARGIPINKRIPAPPFSFKNFDTILTRDRNVAKRVVAGSQANSFNKRWPAYMVEAQELNYEMNILQRVPKLASPVRKRSKKSVSSKRDLCGSGSDSSADDCPVGVLKQAEQGVDELLHLKILQSAADGSGNPGTIVLATGDAANAQYSDGFKSNVERALRNGWHVELYSWSRNISSAWREPEFAAEWGRKFKIIELDQFCEELFDMTIESLEQ
ncbi:hypothetical protein VTK26DRAFT_3568 [Humicola hyalothermophila]